MGLHRLPVNRISNVFPVSERGILSKSLIDQTHRSRSNFSLPDPFFRALRLQHSITGSCLKKSVQLPFMASLEKGGFFPSDSRPCIVGHDVRHRQMSIRRHEVRQVFPSFVVDYGQSIMDSVCP